MNFPIKSVVSLCCSNTVCYWMAAEFCNKDCHCWQVIRPLLWQISICRFCLFHFNLFFLQLDLYVYIKILSPTMCVSKGNAKKPTRDLLSHSHKS